MNPVAMTIINPRKEIGLASIEPTTVYSRVLCTTMCYMSQASLWMNHRLQHQCLYLQTIPKNFFVLILYQTIPTFYSLPKDQILDLSQLDAFSDDKTDMTQKLKFVSVKIENIVGKGENALYQHFLL